MTLIDKAIDAAKMQATRVLFAISNRFSDELLCKIARPHLERIPYPEGRAFLERMMLHARRTLRNCAPGVRHAALNSFVYNAILHWEQRRIRFREDVGVDPPFLVVISPIMRCNLRCTGCYAGNYSKKSDMPRELFEKVLDECRDIGIGFVTISGGEPFLRPDYVEILEKYNDMYFQTYTNGQYLDEEMARRLAKLGNCFPAISVEGFEAETDGRRGKGVFKGILRAMRNLREEGVPFGFSCTATRHNNELVCSDEFVDFWVNQGVYLGWYFNYVPMGKDPDTGLMPTPWQRVYRRRRLREIRARRDDVLIADFWNDGLISGGCLAAGKYYMHINCFGEIEPCVFCHFATHNIRTSSIREAMRSPFFTEYRRLAQAQPDHRAACPLIDHPASLRRAVRSCGAHATHEGAETMITELADELDSYACNFAQMNACEDAGRFEQLEPDFGRHDSPTRA